MNYDVFISCKSEDYIYAEEIYNFLTANGFNTFLAYNELRLLGDAEFRRAISTAMKSAYHMIIFASDARHIDSTWVYYEWDMFLNAKLKGFKEGQIMTILKDVEVEDINMDLWKYESFTFENYKEKLLDYVVTPRYSEMRKALRDNIRINTVYIENNTTENDLIHLISEFSATHGAINIDRRDLEFLYDMHEVAYTLVPIHNFNDTYAHLLALRDKIKKEHLYYSHFVLYLRYAKGNDGLKVQEFSDIVEVMNKINPEAEIKWGYSENGFRNELFIIMAR